MNKTGIEYLDYTWNPISMRCSQVSDGCKNCWHLRYRKRFIHIGTPELRANELNSPKKIKISSRIGVQFNGDLFHEDVPFDFIHKIWDKMKECPQHIFFILTKRPKRMKEIVEKILVSEPLGYAGGFRTNVLLGVSVEDQRTADERIPILLDTLTAHRWVSYEPALEEVDFSAYLKETYYINLPVEERQRAFDNHFAGYHRLTKLDWLVMGGETGPGARPMHPNWARSVRYQCAAAEVPFFFKSWGEWAERHALMCNHYKGKLWHTFDPDTSVCRVGHKEAGHLISIMECRGLPKFF